MDRKLVTVFGATGNQGGSVAGLLLTDSHLKSQYRVRAITRDPSKAAAKALEVNGAELAKADLDDKGSISEAVKGSYAVFGVTNYWESMSTEKEVQQGKNIVDACLSQNVKHLVWSSLPHATSVSGGTLPHIQHFDGKAAVEEYAERKKGANGLITSYFMPAYFYSNLKDFIQKGPDGKPAWAGPFDAEHSNVPMLDVRTDTGKYVAGILEAGEQADGRRVHAVSQWLSPSEVVQTFSDVLGKKVDFHHVPLDAFKTILPKEVADELGENMALIGEYSYYGKGTRDQQADSDVFLYSQAGATVKLIDFIKQNGPWDI